MQFCVGTIPRLPLSTAVRVYKKLQTLEICYTLEILVIHYQSNFEISSGIELSISSLLSTGLFGIAKAQSLHSPIPHPPSQKWVKEINHLSQVFRIFFISI